MKFIKLYKGIADKRDDGSKRNNLTKSAAKCLKTEALRHQNGVDRHYVQNEEWQKNHLHQKNISYENQTENQVLCQVKSENVMMKKMMVMMKRMNIKRLNVRVNIYVQGEHRDHYQHDRQIMM